MELKALSMDKLYGAMNFHFVDEQKHICELLLNFESGKRYRVLTKLIPMRF